MSPITIGIFVTVGFIVIGFLGKAVVHGWRKNDAYMGMEMSLAAMSGAVIHMFELARRVRLAAGIANNGVEVEQLSNLIERNGVFLLASIFFYFFIATLHRSWEDQDDGVAGVALLLGLANFLGGTLLITFILLIKAI
jgi:hypothetical protein